MRRALSVLVSLPVLVVLLAGCAGRGDPISGQERPADAVAQPAPAEQPTGTTARDISYRCGSGREATITVDVPDLADLARRLNRIQVCEYDDGIAAASLTIPCRERTKPVRLEASDGQAVQPSATALCLV